MQRLLSVSTPAPTGCSIHASLTSTDETGDDLTLGPLLVRVVLLGDPVPTRFVHREDGGGIVVEDGLVERLDELCSESERRELESVCGARQGRARGGMSGRTCVGRTGCIGSPVVSPATPHMPQRSSGPVIEPCKAPQEILSYSSDRLDLPASLCDIPPSNRLA